MSLFAKNEIEDVDSSTFSKYQRTVIENLTVKLKIVRGYLSKEQFERLTEGRLDVKKFIYQMSPLEV